MRPEAEYSSEASIRRDIFMWESSLWEVLPGLRLISLKEVGDGGRGSSPENDA